MISGCRNVHPVATRSITTREALRLQSFPDSFRFSGKTGDIRTAIGNAVPPILAYALGRHILKTYIL
jgi:DNA (cytosine-5)-methyltransferase 1